MKNLAIPMHRRALAALYSFMQMEAAGGIVLVIATVLAMWVANSAWSAEYLHLLHSQFQLGVSSFSLVKSLSHWINDGLMVLFFLVVGLELKRELVEGQFADKSNMTLPLVGAMGGMLVPMAIYAWLNAGDSAAMHGLAIPAATDIAFALGILSLLGSRVPMALKMLLLAIAVADDLGAIILIALFYTEQLAWSWLLLAIASVLLLCAMNRFRVRALWAYLLVGAALWLTVLNSGVHATIAGVVLGLIIPLNTDTAENRPAEHLMHSLHPWVAFGILPIFAFANAGVPLQGLQWADLTQSVPMGIALGLFAGKQVGIFASLYLTVKLGLARLNENLDWRMLYGMAILCGIGFTMSLFVGSLSFDARHVDFQLTHRLGILTGSGLSAVAGFALLWLVLPRNAKN